MWTKKYSTVCNADKTYKENVANKAIVKPTTETDSEKNLLFTKLRKLPINPLEKKHSPSGTIK